MSHKNRKSVRGWSYYKLSWTTPLKITAVSKYLLLAKAPKASGTQKEGCIHYVFIMRARALTLFNFILFSIFSINSINNKVVIPSVLPPAAPCTASLYYHLAYQHYQLLSPSEIACTFERGSEPKGSVPPQHYQLAERGLRSWSGTARPCTLKKK